MNFGGLTLRENPIREPYTQAEMEAAARMYNASIGRQRLSERILVDGATHGWIDSDGNRQTGFSFGGEDVDGKAFGALHVWNTRTVYQQVPNRQHVCDFLLLERSEDEQAAALLEGGLGKPTAHYMSWLRRQLWHPEMLRYLGKCEDGYTTEYGEPSCEVRASAPGPGQEVVTDGVQE